MRASGLHLRSIDALALLEREEGSLDDRSLPRAVSDIVESVEYERTDFHYDLSVPGFQNFLADGFVQHNSAKTEMGAAEMSARILGHRPWDGSITDVVHNNWLQLIICQTLSTSGKATIQPRLEKMLGSRILHREKNSSGGIDFYWVQTPGGVDRIKIASQDQHARTASNVSPIEGVEQANVWVDEPPDESIRSSYGRGLRFGMNYGAGMEDLTATFFEGNPEQRIFVFDHLWNMSHRRGGPEKSYFVMGGSIHDNPALMQEDKRKIILKYAIHEQKAREWGMYEELAGKVFPEYDPRVHDYDPGKRAVLVTPEGMLQPLSRRHEYPSHWPIYCIADPHDKRPWALIWVAMDENGEWYVVEEWPRGEFHKMTHYSDAGIENRPEAYAALIKETEEGFPGGAGRVVERFMDKRFGGQEKAGSDGLTVSESMERIGCYFSTDYKAEGRSEIMAGNTIIRELLVGTWKPGEPVSQMQHPHFHVAETCNNVRWSLLHHVHLDKGAKGAENVSEVGKDFIDDLRILGMAIRNVTTGSATENRSRTNARMRQRGDRLRRARM